MVVCAAMTTDDSLFGLAGKVALVTGGSRGIGRSIVLAFARAGADVAVVSRDGARCEEVAAEVRALGRKAAGYGLDLSSEPAIVDAFERCDRDLGAPTVAVHCAGVGMGAPAVSLARAQYQAMLDLHFLGGVTVAQQLAKRAMGKDGALLFVTSIWGLGGQRMMSAYGGAKAAIVNLTQTLAVEWARMGIRVNAIAPGLVETTMTEPLLSDGPTRDKMVRSVPMGRAATPDEMAGAALFLCSKAASYVTGHVLVADGGVTATP